MLYVHEKLCEHQEQSKYKTSIYECEWEDNPTQNARSVCEGTTTDRTITDNTSLSHVMVLVVAAALADPGGGGGPRPWPPLNAGLASPNYVLASPKPASTPTGFFIRTVNFKFAIEGL